MGELGSVPVLWVGVTRGGGGGRDGKAGRMADRSGGEFATADLWVGQSEALGRAPGNRGDIWLHAVPSGGKSHDIGLLPK